MSDFDIFELILYHFLMFRSISKIPILYSLWREVACSASDPQDPNLAYMGTKVA